jgi:hypothetical protein
VQTEPRVAAPSGPALVLQKRFSSWRNVQLAFQQHRHQLTGQDFQMLVRQLSGLARPQFMNRQESTALGTFLDDLSSYARGASATLRAQDWATFLVLLGQLQHHSVDPHLVHQALITLEQNVDSMTAVDLARTISNAISLGSAPVADLQPLIKALGNHMGAPASASAPAYLSADHIEPVISSLKKVRSLAAVAGPPALPPPPPARCPRQ